MAHEIGLSRQQVGTALRNFIIAFSAFYIHDTVILPTMPIMAGYALRLGLREPQVAFLAGLISLMALWSMVGVSLTRGVRAKRRLIVALGVGATLVVMPGLVLVSLLVAPEHRFIAICGLAVTFFLVSNTVFPSVYSWQANVIPDEIRGPYMSKRTLIPTLATIAFLFGAGKWLDRFPASDMRGFYGLLMLGGAIMVGGFLVLGRTPYPRIEAPSGAPLLDHWFEPLRNRDYRRLLLFLVAQAIPPQLAAAFFSLYMIGHLNLTYGHIAWYVNLSYVGTGIGFLLGSTASQRFGSRPILQILAVLYPLVAVAWACTTPATYRLLIPLGYLLGGLITSATFVSVWMMLIRLVPDNRDNSHYFALWVAAQSGAAAVGPFIGALLKSLLPAGPVALLGRSLDPVQIIFAVAACLCLFTIWASRRLLEAGAQSAGGSACLSTSSAKESNGMTRKD